MEQNRHKPPPQKNFFIYLEHFLQRTGLFPDNFPVKYVPYVLYILLFGILYIGNTHYHEKMVRKINQLEAIVEDLRVDFTTLKAAYMVASKQSEVAKRVASMGIYENTKPPFKIKLKDNDD